MAGEEEKRTERPLATPKDMSILGQVIGGRILRIAGSDVTTSVNNENNHHTTRVTRTGMDEKTAVTYELSVTTTRRDDFRNQPTVEAFSVAMRHALADGEEQEDFFLEVSRDDNNYFLQIETEAVAYPRFSIGENLPAKSLLLTAAQLDAISGQANIIVGQAEKRNFTPTPHKPLFLR